MKWNKLGLIFEPDRQLEWMKNYASVPKGYYLGDDIYRVYFASRNEKQQSSGGYFDININNPTVILNYTKVPIIVPGDIGMFDCDGVYPSSIIEIDNKVYMYYIGWNKGDPEPLFRSGIGLAISNDNGTTFKKYSQGPILDRNVIDPLLVSAPTVMKLGERYIMYYVSCEKWERHEDGLHSKYYMKEAFSYDGINWERKNDVALPLQGDEEHICHMSVIHNGNNYEGWYAYESIFGYRIGMAHSEDGISWERDDVNAGMQLSEKGWDSQAQAYPFVFMHGGKRYMLYNGNRNGYDGIGIAIEG